MMHYRLYTPTPRGIKYDASTKLPSQNGRDINKREHEASAQFDSNTLVERCAQELGIKTFDAWYNVVNTHMLKAKGGSTVLHRHKNSLSLALTTAYPHFNWDLSRFGRVAVLYWDSLENQKRAFDNIAKLLHLKTCCDWYKLVNKDVCTSGGNGVLQRYKDSLFKALSHIYPDYQWQRWRFRKLPAAWINDINNQMSMVDDISQDLGVKVLEDWYNVSGTEVWALGASGLFTKNHKSLISTLQSLYPSYGFESWRFRFTPNSTWYNVENQRAKIQEMGEKLRVFTFNEWTRITSGRFIEEGGGAMLQRYDGSLAIALGIAYPNISWKYWQFKQVPTGFWKHTENVHAFLLAAEQDLSLESPESWYRVDITHLRSVGGSGIVSSYPHCLDLLYPNYAWDYTKLSNKDKRATQWELRKHVHTFFSRKPVQ